MYTSGSLTQTETLPLIAGGNEQSGGRYGGGDPYAVPLSTLVDVKQASDDLRRGFVRKVYGILAMQLLLTALIAVPFQFMDKQTLASNVWLVWVSSPSLIGLLCALACNPQLARSYPTNEICLLLVTIFQGILVGYFSSAFTWQSVILAVGMCAVIVVGLTVYAFFTSTDFTGSSCYLFGALLTVLAFSLFLLIMGICGIHVELLAVICDLLFVLLFVMFIIYDTQLILGSWGGHKDEFSLDDYVPAALSLYLDIINLMVELLSLTGTRDGPH